MWAKVFSIGTLKEFKDQAKDYVELLRVGDLEHPNVHPPLRSPPRRPVMVNMTFKGMKMLHRLCSADRLPPFEIPPLSKPDPNSPVLLEVMPGLALKAFDLPSTGYKDGTSEADRKKRRDTRKEILRKLIAASGIELAHKDIPDAIRDKCIQNQGGDALDSLVAAIVAARWARCRSDFLIPSNAVVDSLKRKQTQQASSIWPSNGQNQNRSRKI